MTPVLIRAAFNYLQGSENGRVVTIGTHLSFPQTVISPRTADDLYMKTYDFK